MTVAQPDPVKRPPEKIIRRFHVGMVGKDTVETFLQKGWSLVICCKDCPRVVQWTPPELQSRFGDRLGLRIADLVPRLSCAGPQGCGSHEVAVGPLAYTGAWRWDAPVVEG